MEVTYRNPSFQSKIKFLDSKSFSSKISALGAEVKEVPYPWTVETMKLGDNLYTTNLMECLFGLFSDGEKIGMCHLATRKNLDALRDKVKPFDINNIEQIFLSKFKMRNRNAHAIILGAWEYNCEFLEQMKSLFKKYNTKLTVLGNRKDDHFYGRFSMLYVKNDDTLYLTNTLTTKNKVDSNGNVCGHEVEVLPDGIEFNTYKKRWSLFGKKYKTIRIKSDLKAFLENQFREVSLCKIDEFI